MDLCPLYFSSFSILVLPLVHPNSAKIVRGDQVAIPAAYIRGGSSKAVYFHEHDLPPEGSLRDRVLKRVIGTPDPIQIDGMGGAKRSPLKSPLSDRQPAQMPTLTTYSLSAEFEMILLLMMLIVETYRLASDRLALTGVSSRISE